LVSINLA